MKNLKSADIDIDTLLKHCKNVNYKIEICILFVY